MGLRKPKVGECIEWAKKTPVTGFGGRPYPYGPTREGPGEVLEVRGRNVFVDVFGSTDWLHMSDLAWMNVVEPLKPSVGQNVGRKSPDEPSD